MDWFLYDNGLRHERVKETTFPLPFLFLSVNKLTLQKVRNSFRVTWKNGIT